MEQAHQISEHDRKIATNLAFVLTSGNVPANSRVSEQYLLDLDREAFMSVIGEEKSQARIQSLITTGKLLRNERRTSKSRVNKAVLTSTCCGTE